MVEPCLNCKSDNRMLHWTVVRSGVLMEESACLECKVVYREMVTPTKNDKMRASFTTRGKLNKKEILALKESDRNLYASWLAILDHLGTVTTDQLNHSNEYSEVACHFIYIVHRLIQFLGENLRERIKRLNEWLASERDK